MLQRPFHAALPVVAMLAFGLGWPGLHANAQTSAQIRAGRYVLRICLDHCTDEDTTSMTGELVLLAAPWVDSALMEDARVQWWKAFLRAPVNGCFIPRQTRREIDRHPMLSLTQATAAHWRADSGGSDVAVAFSISPDGSYRMRLSATDGGRVAGEARSSHSPPRRWSERLEEVVGRYIGPADPALCSSEVRKLVRPGGRPRPRQAR